MAVTFFSFHSAEEQKLFFKQERPEEETVGSFGETLTLDCEAGGSPSPTIHWLYNGERIIQVSNLFTEPFSVLNWSCHEDGKMYITAKHVQNIYHKTIGLMKVCDIKKNPYHHSGNITFGIEPNTQNDSKLKQFYRDWFYLC